MKSVKPHGRDGRKKREFEKDNGNELMKIKGNKPIGFGLMVLCCLPKESFMAFTS